MELESPFANTEVFRLVHQMGKKFVGAATQTPNCQVTKFINTLIPEAADRETVILVI
jgi:hypothetical protein